MDLKTKNKEASHAVGFHLYEMSRIDKSIGTENDLWLPGEDGRIGRW